VEAWIVAPGSRRELGRILLPWIYSLIALKSLDYPLEHPVIALGIRASKISSWKTANLRFQAATSPVTGYRLEHTGLAESGHSTTTRPDQSRQLAAGQKKSAAPELADQDPRLEPGGWSFEFKNDWYPDLDDSSLVPRLCCVWWRAGGSAALAGSQTFAELGAGDAVGDGGWEPSTGITT
jgi:squalene-hopene/tetraprenyl-beta-curcumene cyclase